MGGQHTRTHRPLRQNVTAISVRLYGWRRDSEPAANYLIPDDCVAIGNLAKMTLYKTYTKDVFICVIALRESVNLISMANGCNTFYCLDV